MDTSGSINTSEFYKKQLCEFFVFLRSILICAVSEKLSEKRTGICWHTACTACGIGSESGNLSDPARRIPHRTAGAPQMAGHRSHGSGETAGKLSGTTGCTDGGNLVFLFVCIPGFHAVLRGGFFCGNPLLSE